MAEIPVEQGRLDAVTVPTVGDITEFTEAAGLLADAKAAIDAAITERAKAVADGKVTQAEVEALQAKIDAAQAKLDAAENSNRSSSKRQCEEMLYWLKSQLNKAA